MWPKGCIIQLCGLHVACGLDTHGLGIQLAFSNRTNQEGAMDHSLKNWIYSTILQFIFSKQCSPELSYTQCTQ
jgi:hypothetical protein